MRSLPLVVVLLAALAGVSPARADETAPQSLADGVKAKAQPLLKALSLIGTPYKFGSSNPDKGLDCSGLVKHVYKESADISLPRSAAEMSKQGEQVAKTELKPGDLVFFNTMGVGVSHVGLVVDASGPRFYHASSSKGVTESDLSKNYYKTRYLGARRVIP